jgi:hypothetical protein
MYKAHVYLNLKMFYNFTILILKLYISNNLWFSMELKLLVDLKEKKILLPRLLATLTVSHQKPKKNTFSV